MPRNGVTNSVFIMQLTKEQLTEAHEQGLSISTKIGNIKIVTILGDVYGVNHFNSNKVNWWLFEQFEKQEATIEPPKPKIDFSILKEGEIYYTKGMSNYEYIFILDKLVNNRIMVKKGYTITDKYETYEFLANVDQLTELRLPTESELELFYSKFPDLKPKKYNGRAVKCDNVEQYNYLLNKLNRIYVNGYLNGDCFCISDKDYSLGDINFFTKLNYEIISFSDYCKENNLTEPKWIQGFEVGKDYNDVVMVSDDNINWYIEKLVAIKKHPELGWQFETQLTYYKYCRYPKRNEINEIKFID